MGLTWERDQRRKPIEAAFLAAIADADSDYDDWDKESLRRLYLVFLAEWTTIDKFGKTGGMVPTGP